VGLGVCINIPVGLDKTKTTKDTDSDGIHITEEQKQELALYNLKVVKSPDIWYYLQY